MPSPRLIAALVAFWVAACATPAAPVPEPEELTRQFAETIHPILRQYCVECHSSEKHKGDIDFERLTTFELARGETKTWEKALDMVRTDEMPPEEEPQPSAAEREQFEAWVSSLLTREARAQAGDPGRVVMRRLSNVEYTLTVRDLTGVALDPAKEFPADGAAGEGFVNTGEALVMSPSLFDKYLAAAKEIARHAVLLPDGIQFSASTDRGDWIDERLKAIREFYARYTQAEGGQRINLQGIVFDTNTGGRLPLERYLAATLEAREALRQGAQSTDELARERGLNAQYLASLWALLNQTHSSPLLSMLCQRWQSARATDAVALTAEIERWQAALTRFQTVGHMKPWVVPVNPLVSRHEVRWKIPVPTNGQDSVLYLVAGDTGDGHEQDFVIWEKPRLIVPGRPPLPLRDVRAFAGESEARRSLLFASTAKSLAAAAEVRDAADLVELETLARLHGVDFGAVAAWCDYLGLGSTRSFRLDLFTNQIAQSANYDFVKGWGSNETPNLVANASDQPVRIPGNMKPRGVALHPSPALEAAVGWKSPVSSAMRVQILVTHAHPECGNGVTWSLELRRGATRQRLAAGTAQGSAQMRPDPIESLPIKSGDLISLLIGPRDGNHACDLTDIEMIVSEVGGSNRTWQLTREVSGDILAGNPRADGFGNMDVWHFYTEPVSADVESGPVIPPGSILARWLMSDQAGEKAALAQALQTLLVDGPPANSDAPDAKLYAQLSALGGPLLASARARAIRTASGASDEGAVAEKASTWGLDPAQFGIHPNGSPIDRESLCVRAPSVLEIRLPSDLAPGGELVTTAVLDPVTAPEGSAQVSARTSWPAAGLGLMAAEAKTEPGGGPWGAEAAQVISDAPILVQEGSAAWRRIESGFDEFRRWFPAALCYPKIVPVDEVITLTVFHREDEALRRLMLGEAEKAELDRLWDELRFIGQDALTMVDAYVQLMEYATQDSNPKLFEHLRQPIQERAANFRRHLAEAEPRHLGAVEALAARAYRRPLTADETSEMRQLYGGLRGQDLSHEDAFRLTLARVLVAPWFLYRVETPAPGDQPGPVSDWELASRLSYFLWSSMPDEKLRQLAGKGVLRDPDTLVAEARRLLSDRRARALSTEFACQWLHIRDFDSLDEKSDRHYPTFAGLRADMYEESIRFFVDLFQRDGSVLEMLDADHTFLNGALAVHYGIPGVTGAEWRRVDGVRRHGRGGLLTMATVLAKQSGASRTSPILRGAWLSETLLGEPLPKPPPNVPQLPEAETDTGQWTVRQITEAHSKVPECARCHVRIDPFGFALERYDGIGRLRETDLAGRPIDDRAHLSWKDDVDLDGLPGLRSYLLTRRKAEFVRVFCRKLLGYALGRGLQLSDMPLIEEMEAQLGRNDYRFFAAVETILRSQAFRYQRGLEATREEER